MIESIKNYYRKYPVVTAGAALCLAVIILEIIFFRHMIFNPDNMIGDNDAKYISAVIEHWFAFFGGKVPLRDMPVFYPVPNTLGYSDTLFLLALPYSLLRALGVSWLTSLQCVVIGVHCFGSLCMAWLLWRKLKLPLWACIIGIIVACVSRPNYIKLMHLQFITYSLLPLFLIFLYNFYSNFRRDLRKKRILYAVSAILLYCGILLTAFHVGFFTAMFLLVLHLFAAVYFIIKKKTTAGKILKAIWANKFEGLLYIAVTALSLIPFLWVYLPVFGVFGDRSEVEIRMFLPELSHFINVYPAGFPELVEHGPAFYELSVGFPLITGIILITGCIYLAIRRPPAGFSDSYERNLYISLTKGFALTILITSLFVADIPIRGRIFNLWWYISDYVPGASSIRAVCRYIHFLSIPAGIVIACFLSRCYWKNAKSVIIKAVMCVLLVTVIFAENQGSGANTLWSKSEANEYLETIPLPPDDCEVFFLINVQPRKPDYYNVDAMRIAYHFNIKTIHGLSGQFPPDWMELWHASQSGSFSGLLRWIDKHNLENVYLYDELGFKWILCSEENLKQYERHGQ